MIFLAVARAATVVALVAGAHYAATHAPADIAAGVLALPIAFKCCVVGNVFFWGTSLMCLLMDLTPRSTGLGKALAASKIQHRYQADYWLDAVCVAVMNLMLISPAVCVFYERVWASGLGGQYVRLQVPTRSSCCASLASCWCAR